MEAFLTNWGIFLAQLLVVVGALMAVGFAVFQIIMGLIDDPTATLKSILGILVLALLLFFIYMLTSGQVEGTIFDKAKYSHIDSGTMKMVAGGINSALFLTLGGIIIAVVLEIMNMFK